VAQNGAGHSWWERSVMFLGRVKAQAAEVAKTTWRKFVDARKGRDDTKGPNFDM